MRALRIRTGVAIISALGQLLLLAQADAQSRGTIKVATQSPLSGSQAVRGEALKLGAQLAVEQKKESLEQLGFTVEFVAFDDKGKPEVGAANAASILADEEILLVVGHLDSGVAIEAAKTYKEANLAMISPANAHPVVTDRNYPNVSRVCGRDDVQGEMAAEFSRNALKVKTAYVLHDRTTYGLRVAEYFRDHAKAIGIEVVGFEGTDTRSKFDPIIAPMKAKNPDLVYFSGVWEQGAPFFKTVREEGVKAIFMGPDGMDSADLVKMARSAVKGMYYTVVTGPVSMYPKAKEFVRDYKEKFKKDPERYSAQAYDAASVGLMAMEQAIQAAGGKMPTREQVSAAVRKIKYRGLTSEIEFDAKGDRKESLYFVLQILSDDPAKWDDNEEMMRLTIAAPPRDK